MALVPDPRAHRLDITSPTKIPMPSFSRPARNRNILEMLATHDHPPGLCDALLSLLSIRDLMRLAIVSSTTRAAVKRYTTSAWDPNTFLAHWFSYAEGFRSILAETGAIVTGSQMIQYLDRLPPLKDSDLDIVTRIGGLLPLVMFLQRQGYDRVPRPSFAVRDDDYPVLSEVFGVTSSPSFLRGGGRSGIIHVMDFEKTCYVNTRRTLLKVQIVVSAKPPIEHVLGFHSTGVMNFMTHKQAISVFPEATFELRKFFVTSREPLGDAWNPAWVEKYSQRGFHIDRFTAIPAVEMGIRSVDDKHSWVITFGDGSSSWLRSAERSGMYATDLHSTSFKFELAWVPEWSNVDSRMQYRILVLEREIWFYLWPVYLNA